MRKNILTSLILGALTVILATPAVAAFASAEVNDSAATVRTFAGTGVHGSRDGRLAQFNLPAGIFGTEDTIYIADTYNNLIRSINFQGITSRLAGDFIAFDKLGFSAGLMRDGYNNYALFNRPADGVILEDRLNALFNRPTDGVVLEDGRIFVVDSANHAIRVIEGNRTYTFSGGARAGMANGPAASALFNHPSAIVLDMHGNMYVADTLNHVIRKISYDGTVSTIAGMPGLAGFRDGATYEARFHAPMGIAVSNDGTRIYVADTGNHIIRVIEDGQVRTLAGNSLLLYTEIDDDRSNLPTGSFADGPGEYAWFNLPKGIALHGDNLIVADHANHKLRVVQPCGRTSTLSGTGFPGYKNGSADIAEFHFPSGVLVNRNQIFVVDTGNNLIRVIQFTGGE